MGVKVGAVLEHPGQLLHLGWGCRVGWIPVAGKERRGARGGAGLSKGLKWTRTDNSRIL